MLTLRNLRIVAAALTLGVGPLAVRAQSPFIHPAEASPERRFDFWIGEWDVTNRRLQQDGSWQEFGASAIISPAIDGRVIVEHWASRAESWPMRGFSMRAYDPATDSWTILLCWPDPNGDTAGFGFMQGRFRNGRGEFFPKGQLHAGETPTVRFTFSDAGPNSLRWDQATRTDDGAWRTTWIMEWTRRSPDEPLETAWAQGASDEQGVADDVRLLERLAGSWRMDVDPRTMEARPMFLSSMRGVLALHGFALLARFEERAAEFADPAVRNATGTRAAGKRLGLLIAEGPGAYAYCEITDASPTFMTFRGDFADGQIVLTEASGVERLVIAPDGDDRAIWIRESRDGDLWMATERLTLERELK